jgi:hypothetical protein
MGLLDPEAIRRAREAYEANRFRMPEKPFPPVAIRVTETPAPATPPAPAVANSAAGVSKYIYRPRSEAQVFERINQDRSGVGAGHEIPKKRRRRYYPW